VLRVQIKIYVSASDWPIESLIILYISSFALFLDQYCLCNRESSSLPSFHIYAFLFSLVDRGISGRAMESIALSQRLHSFSLPGRGWASRHHATRQRIRKMSASWSPPSDHEYRIPDEKEASTTVDAVLERLEKKRRFSVALPNEEISRDFVAITGKKPLVKRPERSPSKCVVSDKKQIVSIALPNDEITRDFAAITGKKPLKKPRKRSKIVQEEMDRLFPGSGLCPIILACYKAPPMV